MTVKTLEAQKQVEETLPDRIEVDGRSFTCPNPLTFTIKEIKTIEKLLETTFPADGVNGLVSLYIVAKLREDGAVTQEAIDELVPLQIELVFDKEDKAPLEESEEETP